MGCDTERSEQGGGEEWYVRAMFVHSEVADDGRPTTTVVGELDMATTPLLLDHVATLPVVPQMIDLRFTSFMDASGAEGLLEIRRGGPITVVRSDAVDRVLAIWDLEDELPAGPIRSAPALRTSPTGFAVHDDDLRFVFVNDALAAINGLPSEAHLGRTGPELFAPVVDELTPVLRSVLEARRPVSRVVTSEIGGSRNPWQCVYTPAAFGGRSHVVARVEPLSGSPSMDGPEVSLRFAS